MTLGHEINTRTAVADVVVDRLDAATPTPGKVKFYTANYATLLCTITLALPAFASASNGAAVMLSVPLEGTCVAGGTVVKFRFTTGADVEVINGDVGLTGADINLNQVTVVTNDVIRLTGITYNAAA